MYLLHYMCIYMCIYMHIYYARIFSLKVYCKKGHAKGCFFTRCSPNSPML